MTESTTASATIDISELQDVTGLRDTIKGAIGDKRLSLFIDNTETGDKTADIEVQGMTDPELRDLLAGLNFRLVEKATPTEEKATAVKPANAAEKCPEGYFPWIIHIADGTRMPSPESQETWTHYIEIRDPARLDAEGRLGEGESDAELTAEFLTSKGIDIKKVTFKEGQTVFVKYDEATYLASGGEFNKKQNPPKLQPFMIEDIRLG